MARAEIRVRLEIGPAEAVADLMTGLDALVDRNRDGDTEDVLSTVRGLLDRFRTARPHLATHAEPTPGPDLGLLTRAAEGLRDPLGLQCAGMREDLRAHLADLLSAIASLDRHMEAGGLHDVPKTIVEVAAVVVIARDAMAAALLGVNAQGTPRSGP